MNVHFTSQYFLYNYYCNGGLKFTVWYNAMTKENLLILKKLLVKENENLPKSI